MRKILSFEQFKMNEEDNFLMQALGGILSGKVDSKLPRFLFPGQKEEPETAVPGDSTSRRRFQFSGDYKVTPGNDDFSLYMQHQQGQTGAAGIVKAAAGKGKMHPDTIKTKSGVKYANLVGNIPSDQPEVKKDIIAALDAGDQQKAALLFMNMWKEKWNRKSQEAKRLINEPQNAETKKAIEQASEKYGIPFDFAIAVANIESGFNPKAGNARYKGLFAMDPNQSYGGIVTPMGNKWADPYVNAENGVRLLRRQIVDFKKKLGNSVAVLNLSPWAKNLA